MKKPLVYFFFLANITLFAFVAVNLLAIPIIRYGFFNTKFREELYDRFWVKPSADPQLIQQAYPGESMAVVGQKQLANQPMIHTVLENTSTPVRSAYVNVGIEGIRYYSRNTRDAEMQRRLETPGATWAFGGSTTYGWGVGDDETWPFYYDRLSSNVINFGIPAYSQDDEIKKLVYLLKKGYRPARVVFLDGLNDVQYNAGNNYRFCDQYSRFGKMPYVKSFSHDWLFNSESRRVIYENLPLTILLRHVAGRFNFSPETVRFDKDANTQPFNHAEAMYLNERNVRIYEAHPRQINQKILDYYRANIAFVKDLGKGLGFAVHFFYQPLGVLDAANPFLKPNWSDYTASRLYRQFAGVKDVVGQAMADGRLEMIDLSRCLEDLAEPRYVDPSHYTKFANERIARVIYRHTHGD